MKKISMIVALITIATLSAEIKEKKSAQSFYFMQPLFTLGSKCAGWRNLLFSHDQSRAIRIIGGITESYKSSEMAQYFLMNHKEALIVRGSAHADYGSNTTDIRGEWIGLPNNFEGTLTLDPEYESWGVLLSGKVSLGNFCDCSFLKRSSLFFEIPVVHNKTNLKFIQNKVSHQGPAGNAVHDILTAFNNKNWTYQKISTTPLETTRLSEVRLGLANTFLLSKRALVALSSAFSIPTTPQYKNNYMFEPQGGYNGHPGFISTIHMALPLTEKETEIQFSLFVDGEHTWLIRTKQHRTFDLKNKPWSRFLLLRDKNQITDTTIPAMNVLTRNVRISPYSMLDGLVGLRISGSLVSFELGFGAWGHHKGRIKFTDEWQEIYGIAGSALNTSASESTITTRAANDADFVTIAESDLDIDSALSPSTVIYKAHAFLDITHKSDKWDFLASVGVEMQAPRNNTNGFKTWSFFATTGAGF